MNRRTTTPGNRFNRRGEVIPETRTMSSTYGTDAYSKGDPSFERRPSSVARIKFKAARFALRANDPTVQARAEKWAARNAAREQARRVAEAAANTRKIAAASKGAAL